MKFGVRDEDVIVECVLNEERKSFPGPERTLYT